MFLSSTAQSLVQQVRSVICENLLCGHHAQTNSTSSLVVLIVSSSWQAYTQSLSKVYEKELKDFFEAAKQRTLTKGIRSKC